MLYENLCLTNWSQKHVQTMPVDNKRITGPETTVPYQLFTKQQPWDETFAQSFSKADLRLDDRKSDEHRKICKKVDFYCCWNKND